MPKPSVRASAFLWLFAVGSCSWPERSYEQAPEGVGDDDWTETGDFDAAFGPSTDDGNGGAGGSGGASGAPATSDTGASGGPSGPTPKGSAGSSASPTDAPLLDQAGNPIYQQLTTYAAWLSTASTPDAQLAADRTLADNLLSWQMPHGGFFKLDFAKYAAPWNGTEPRSDWTGANDVELGTIDNNATVTELLFLADVYQRTGEESYRDGARRALDFLLGMQFSSGGFPQVYPERPDSYSNHVTFNDDAMARVLVLLLQLTKDVAPLDGDLFSEEQKDASAAAIESAVEFILDSQIEQDGVKTVWCAQHDAVTYEPRGARSYELPSKSGKESVGVATFLMTQPQTPEVEAAVKAAIAWYESDAVVLEDTAYINRPESSTDDSYNPIRMQPGSTMWCRFYELEGDVCFFSGRLPTDDPPGTGKQYDIMEIEPERRYGYTWGGNFGAPLLNYAASVGY